MDIPELSPGTPARLRPTGLPAQTPSLVGVHESSGVLGTFSPAPQPHPPLLLFALGLGWWWWWGNQFSFYLDWRLSGQPRKKTLIYDQKEVGCEDSGRQGWVGAKR